jgi:hypothetical protein
LTDKECVELLRLLHKYVSEYGDSADMTISEMAEDLAMSMDETTDEADQLRVEIVARLA